MFYQRLNSNFVFLRNQSFTIHASEVTPIFILGVCSVIGCCLNMTAACIYCRKEKAFQNPGNVFTMSLIVVDLLFNGVSIPLLIGLRALESTPSLTSKQALSIASHSLLFFNSISSAIGNTLVAFDRLDLTQRPVNRYLERKKTICFVSAGWLIAVISLLSPLLAAALQSKITYNETIILHEYNYSSKIANADEDVDEGFTETNHAKLVCFGNCFKENAGYVQSYSSSQVFIQLIFFIFATLMMTLIYGKIYHSLNKKTCRYEITEQTATLSPSKFKFSSFMKETFGCIRVNDDSLHMQNTEVGCKRTSGNNQVTGLDKNCPRQQQEHPIVFPQMKNETTNFSKSKSKERVQFCRSEARAYDSTATSDKTDFASVAFSVKTFMSIKKAVRERKKRKQRKLRQFRRMSVKMVLAYIFSWLPFQVFSLVTFLNTSQHMMSTCKINNCSNPLFQDIGKEISLTSDQATESNIAFLWCLVFASLSTISNALLYSFSKENIKRELTKTYNSIKKSNTLNLTSKKNLSKTLQMKTTNFMSLNVFKKVKPEKPLAKFDTQPNTPSWSDGNINNRKQVPKIVPLKDPDSVNHKYCNASREHSMISFLSSDKSTVEISLASSKSVTNSSLD